MGWSYLSSSFQETARQNYVDLVTSLSSSSASSSQVKPGADKEQQGSENVVVTSEDGITKIMLNRPTKKNAITTQVSLPALGVCSPFLFFLCLLYLKTTVFQHHSYFSNVLFDLCRKISNCGYLIQQSMTFII